MVGVAGINGHRDARGRGSVRRLYRLPRGAAVVRTQQPLSVGPNVHPAPRSGRDGQRLLIGQKGCPPGFSPLAAPTEQADGARLRVPAPVTPLRGNDPWRTVTGD